MAIISLILVLALPALYSSGGTGRRAAADNLVALLDSARAHALQTGQPTILVFPDEEMPNAVTPYRSYAVFTEKADGTIERVGNWQSLPEGIVFADGSRKIGGMKTVFDAPEDRHRTVPVYDAAAEEQTEVSLPSLEFNSLGHVVRPGSTAYMNIVVAEGAVRAGEPVFRGRDSSGNLVRETIQVGRISGRGKRL